MASKIEQIIEEIEVFIDECRPVTLSSTMIKVNKDELESLVQDLKSNTPEEIRQYQKMIANKDRIIATAQEQADKILAQAKITTDKLVSEHQVMLQAYQKADEVVRLANAQATRTIDEATKEATEIRMAAVEYTDKLLEGIQQVLSGAIDVTRSRDQQFLSAMQGYLDTVDANRASLLPEAVMTQNRAGSAPVKNPSIANAVPDNSAATDASADKNKSALDVPSGFFKKEN